MSKYPIKLCVRYIYSVYVNKRWLCVKHGCTVTVRDYCKLFEKRICKEEKIYDNTEISVGEMAPEMESVDMPTHMPIMPLPQ